MVAAAICGLLLQGLAACGDDDEVNDAAAMDADTLLDAQGADAAPDAGAPPDAPPAGDARACDPATPAEPGRIAVWSELVERATLRDRLPLLASEGADLYLNVRSVDIGDADLAALLSDARAAGVTVRAWLTLPYEEGYWATEGNVMQLRTAALAFAAWRDAACLPVDWIIFDMEMSYQRSTEYASIVASQGVSASIDFLRQGEDPELHAAARLAYTELVAELKTRGLKVMAVTYPFVLDDAADGDQQIEDRMDVPITGVPWDEVSFMVYQSQFAALAGFWVGPDLVQSYAATAVAQFPEAIATLALGLIGPGGGTGLDGMAYPDAATLFADQAAAYFGGVPSLSLFSLDGLLQRTEPPGDWLDAAIEPAAAAPGQGEAVRSIISAFLDS